MSAEESEAFKRSSKLQRSPVTPTGAHEVRRMSSVSEEYAGPSTAAAASDVDPANKKRKEISPAQVTSKKLPDSAEDDTTSETGRSVACVPIDSIELLRTKLADLTKYVANQFKSKKLTSAQHNDLTSRVLELKGISRDVEKNVAFLEGRLAERKGFEQLLLQVPETVEPKSQ